MDLCTTCRANPRVPGRRICNVCRNRQRGQAAKRQRQRAKRAGDSGCNETCSMWRRCRAERLWANGPVPCEQLLADEIGFEYEVGDLTLWVMPLRQAQDGPLPVVEVAC